MSKPLRKLTQTTTSVHGADSLARQRAQGRLREHNTLCCMLVFAQLFFGLTLYMLSRSGPAAWWTITLLSLPTVLLGFGAQRLARRGGAPFLEALGKLGGAWLSAAAAVLLALSLLVDMQLAMLAFSQLSRGFVLSDTARWTSSLTGAITAIVALVIGGRQAMTRFAFLGRFLLLATLAIVLASVARYGRVGNLFPFAGQGVGHSLKTGVWALGGTWGAVLFFVQPSDAPRVTRMRKALPPLLLGVALCALVALGYSYIQPFFAFSRRTSFAERMLVMEEG